jgi:hypothetical protein
VNGVKDLSGNTMTVPYGWWFKVQGIWTQSTVADFSSGSTNGTIVANNSGGEIQLAQLLQEEFSGSSLDATKWTTSSWTSSGGGQTSITTAGGILTLGGAAIFSSQSQTNTAVEGRIAFGAAANQHFGLATGLSTVAGNYWAIFSTKNTTNHLFARVNSNGTTNDVDLGTLPAGFHLFRVQPTSTGFQFFVDDVLKTTVAATFQATRPLKAALSVFNGASQPLMQADWVKFNSYSTTQSGSFTSGVLDAGQTVDWSTASWTADLPAGTTIKVETISSLDGVSWTDWAEVVGGNIASPNGRYLRYRITLTTTDPALTPVVRDISFTWK